MVAEQAVMYGSCAQCHEAGSLPWTVTRQTPNSMAMSKLDYHCCCEGCARMFAQKVGGAISGGAPALAEMQIECAPATMTNERVAYQGVYWRYFWNAQKMTKTHLFKHFPDRGYADLSPEEGKTVCGESIPNYFYPVDLRGVTVGRGICKRCSAKVNPVTRPNARYQCLNCGLAVERQRKPHRCIRCKSESMECR